VTVDVGRWAAYLQSAVDDRREVAPISATVADLSIDDAYAIQDELVGARVAAGDVLVGAKLGLTSVAKQQQMGVSEPAYGWIPASSVIGAAGEVRLDQLIHPRVEPEFVFVLGSDLHGSTITADDVLDATDRVVGGIEVIDSRYERFKFGLADVIADQTSAARVAIGSTGVVPREVDLREVTCTFTVDGEVTGTATGAALLGDPAVCVAQLVRHLAESGRGLQAGWLVLAGAPLDARPLVRGTVATASYSHFGDVTVRGV
jgi:2-oxo-3-hexenedioate decarboxylase